MNATVSRIVELLFEDVQMTEETEAIHDEVMNNCQERYASLVAEGYSEDDAIGAVVESLKGMDEVLKDYPRKNSVDDSAAFRKDSAEDDDGFAVIQWDLVKNLQVNVKSADVNVLESMGEQSLKLEHGTKSWLKARVEGSTLVITQEERDVPQTNSSSTRGGFSGALSRLFGGSLSFNWDDCALTLAVPSGMLQKAKIHTLSGDIRMETNCQTVSLETASGDCQVALEGKSDGSGMIHAQTISGDIDVSGTFRTAEITSTSGDLAFNGSAEKLEVVNVSGDVNVQSASSHVKGSTVSGDADITLSCEERANVELSTVSGDINLQFTKAGIAISASTSTRSGDVEFHNVSLMDDAPIKVRCTSVSGDISIG